MKTLSINTTQLLLKEFQYDKPKHFNKEKLNLLETIENYECVELCGETGLLKTDQIIMIIDKIRTIKILKINSDRNTFNQKNQKN